LECTEQRLVSMEEVLRHGGVARTGRRVTECAGCTHRAHYDAVRESATRKEVTALAGVSPFPPLKGRRAIWGGQVQVRAVLYMADLGGPHGGTR
jgi:hypothetical protein